MNKYENLPDGCTQLCKIIENGFKGNRDKMIGYIDLYLSQYSDGAFAKLLNALKSANDNPDGFQLLETSESIIRKDLHENIRMDLSKYDGSYSTKEAKAIAKKIQKDIDDTIKYG